MKTTFFLFGEVHFIISYLAFLLSFSYIFVLFAKHIRNAIERKVIDSIVSLKSNYHFKIKGIRKLTKEKWLNLFRVDYFVRGDAGKRQWIFASRKKNPLVDNTIKVDAAIIVPLHKDGLVVIKEYRIPVGREEYGFPAGLIDTGETIQQCAARELFEETGLKLTSIKSISPPVTSTAGLTDECTVFVFCECEGEIKNSNNEIDEDIDVTIMNQKMVSDLLYVSLNLIAAKAWPIFSTYGYYGNLDCFALK